MVYTSLILASSTVSAEPVKCKYGAVDAWFSYDEETWFNTTVDYAPLRKGQPFYVKIELHTLDDDIWVAIRFSEVGEDNEDESTFQLIGGPRAFYEPFDVGRVPAKDSYLIYTWIFKIKDDTSWVNGTAPLNILVQFDKKKKQGGWDSSKVFFTIVNAFILDEKWNEGDNTIYESPNVSILLIIILLFMKSFSKRYIP